MSEPSLAVMAAVYKRLTENAGVTALVPAANIFDRSTRPLVFPSIILGEDQVVDAERDLARTIVYVFSTIHVWTKSDNLTSVKAIVGAIRRAIRTPTLLTLASSDFGCADCRVADTRFLRDPSGEHAHGIVTLHSWVQETWVLAS